MKGEKFYEMLDLLDDNLVLESAEVKRRVWNWRLTLIGIILAGLVGVWLITSYPVRHPTESLGGEPGTIQNGAYYAYAGSGIPIPGQTLVPQGIFRYVPGEGKTCVVSLDDHKVSSLFRQWGANIHGLYFVDYSDQALWRLDPETGEETRLITLGEITGQAPEETPAEPQETEEEDVWTVFRGLVTGERSVEELMEQETPEEGRLFLELVSEDGVWVCYEADGQDYDLKLDGETGQILAGPIPWETDSRWQWLCTGDRIITLTEKDYPAGFTYPNWEEDQKAGNFFWMDVLEDGVSLLPEGMTADATVCKVISGGVLIGYLPKSHESAQGEYVCWATDHLLLTPEGETYALPKEIEGLYPNYLGAAGGWLYYVSNDHENPDVAQRGYHLRAWNLETGETRLIQEKFGYQELVTDGHWLYKCLGGRTDCYTIDYDAQGKPCGLTLVEEDI